MTDKRFDELDDTIEEKKSCTIYYFFTSEGECISREFKPREPVPTAIRLEDDRIAKRKGVSDAEAAAAVVGVGSHWEVTSRAAGCLPSERTKFMEDSIKKGVPTEFNEKGEAVFTSRSHRRKYCETYKLPDNQGGFLDYTGSSQHIDDSEYADDGFLK